MKRAILYIGISGLTACGTPREFSITPEFDANNRATEIYTNYKAGYLPRLLGYEAFKDSVWLSSKKIANTPYSFIFRNYSITELTTETQMEFGNADVRCTIHYGTFEMTRSPNPGAIDILLNKNANENMHDEKQVVIGGTIEYPGFNGPLSFGLNQRNGFLLIGKDSFLLKPLFLGEWKLMQTYSGVQLWKGDTAYGVLYTFTSLFRHHAYIYTRATAFEQLLIAAYFAVIERYV